MEPLPDDVLLVIFGHADIDTFLILQLLNRKARDLIKAHSHGLAQAVAESTFPRQTRITASRPLATCADSSACLCWLKGLRYQQMAAIMLECRQSDSVAAEDALGDPFRDALARGWQVVASFASIARDVQTLSASNLPPRELLSVDSVEDEAEAVKQLRVLEICARRLAYVGTLSLDDILGFLALRKEFLQCIFGFPDDRESRTAYQAQIEPGNIRSRDWVTSYLAELGTNPFWEAWRSLLSRDGSTTLKEEIENAWTARANARKYEAHAMSTVLHQMECIRTRVRGRLWNPTRTQRGIPREVYRLVRTTSPHGPYKEREALTAAGEPVPPRVLRNIVLRQPLDLKIIGHTPTARLTNPLANTSGRRRESIEVTPAKTRIQCVFPEFKKLYEEWYEKWKEAGGLEKVVEEMRARLTEQGE